MIFIIQAGDVPPDPSDSSGSDLEELPDDNYSSLLKSFSKTWLEAQLTHRVSISGANAFWDMAFKNVPRILQLKALEGIRKQVPQYINQRRVIYKEVSPEVKMSFVFKDKTDGSIIHVAQGQTPLNEYERDPKYQKLYEVAHIEVTVKHNIN